MTSINHTDRNSYPTGMIRGCWVLILLTCAASAVPAFGFAAWFFGIPVLLATFILSIIVLTKGATTQGVMLLISTVIFAPLVIFLAPIISTTLATLLGFAATAGGEIAAQETNRRTVATESALGYGVDRKEVPSEEKVTPREQQKESVTDSLPTTYSPSFDCAKARSFAENTICESNLLSGLDWALGNNYKSMLAANIGDGARSNLRSTQREWVKERDKCRSEHCLIALYRERVDTICEYPVESGIHPGCHASDEF